MSRRPSAAASKNGAEASSRTTAVSGSTGLLAGVGREDHGAVVVEHAPVAADEDQVVGGHLARAALAAGLDDRLRERGDAPEVVARELAAARVRRQRASGAGRPARHERASFTLRAEPV